MLTRRHEEALGAAVQALLSSVEVGESVLASGGLREALDRLEGDLLPDLAHQSEQLAHACDGLDGLEAHFAVRNGPSSLRILGRAYLLPAGTAPFGFDLEATCGVLEEVQVHWGLRDERGIAGGRSVPLEPVDARVRGSPGSWDQWARQ